MDAGISQGGYDPCFGFRSQGRNRPAIFGMFLNTETVGFGGGFEFHIVVIAVVAYVLDIMLQVIQVAHFMEECGGYLRNGAVEIFGAKVDLPVKFVLRTPDFMDAAPAVCAASAVRGYGDSRAEGGPDVLSGGLWGGG